MARQKPPSGQNTTKREKDPPVQVPETWDEHLVDGVLSYRFELAGILLFLLAIVTFLALLGLTQAGWLVWWTRLLRQLLGWGAFVTCLLIAAGGIYLVLRRVEKPFHIRASQVLGFVLIVITLMALSHLIRQLSLADAFAGNGGGLVGWALSEPMVEFFGPFLAALIYLSLIILSVMLMTGRSWEHIQGGLERLSVRLALWADRVDPDRVDVIGRAHSPSPDLSDPNNPITDDIEPVVIELADDEGNKSLRRDGRLPGMDLLERGETLEHTRDEIIWKSLRIEETLLDFGLPAKVVEVRRGPAVTQFGVEPGYVERPGPDGEIKQQKVRVGQIAGLQRDLTLALAVSRLRIEAPVPGRSVVGIEVPNNKTSLVRLRGILESPIFSSMRSSLGVALGRDVAGMPTVIDLAKLPHLLIAGTTGSGKSVLINAFITCLVFNNTPEQLNLVMIDPKKVELVRFNGLPHLIGHVEVEADRAVGVLRWLTAEMDRRYELFEQMSARNIGGYNRKVGRGSKTHRRLPYIGVFIDELADLMHMYPGDVERNLCRLAQMARATGIHLVVATQRPSTDVITGLIKANFPARLSFSVASGTDSRVILDSVGAENLLGRGDMLYQAPDAAGPARIQGVYVTDSEIEHIVAHWQGTMPEHVPSTAPWEPLIARYALLDETDSLLESAVELAKKNDQLSVSFLQRRLRLGYPRAARLMEHLYEMGLVDDPQSGGKTRRTFVDPGTEDPIGEYLNDQDG
jgi:DNA segregation ATPase FtsK/SpoIIIE, S-DNA-T family